jgi:transcriptional regulator GlxA family with amidase domain
MRNLRLDHARSALDQGDVPVGEVAARFGFGSSTTFALEYRKRFGMSPSRTKRARRTSPRRDRACPQVDSERH